MNVFPIEPSQSRYLWLLVPVAVILIAAMAVLVVSLRGAQSSRFEVLPDGLRLSGDLYGRTIAHDNIQLDAVRRVDLATESRLRPASRRMGTGMPGYQSGWFRLRNGEKALLYLTDHAKAVYIPTTEGYSVLLSPADPDGFINALRAHNVSNR
jgi:hypothetical protein